MIQQRKNEQRLSCSNAESQQRLWEALNPSVIHPQNTTTLYPRGASTTIRQQNSDKSRTFEMLNRSEIKYSVEDFIMGRVYVKRTSDKIPTSSVP